MGILAISAAILCAPLGAQEFKFDFGPEDSPVMEGYTKVTEKDKLANDKTHGWVLPKKVRTYSRNENFSTQRAFLKMGPALCDHVTAGRNYYYPNKTYKFAIKLDKGEYVAVAIMGKMTEKYATTINRPPYWYVNYKVSANGKEVVSVDHGDLRKYLGEFCSASEDNFLPGDSIFDKLLKKYFPAYEFSFSGDKLELEMSAVCPINALLIYPKSEKAKLKEELTKLFKAEEDAINAQYKEKKPETKELPEELKKKYAANGFVLFNSQEEEINPYTKPSNEEAFRPLGEFLPSGEKGILRFGLLPLEELKGLKITLSDLTSKDGEKISAKNLDLWLSQCTAYTGEGDTIYYTISPYYAFKYKPQNFKARVSRQFFIYVKTPKDAKSGDYTGELTAKSGSKEAKLKLFVKVLPFKLSKLDITMGMYAYGPKSTRIRFATMQKQGREMYKTQRELNKELQEKGLSEMKEAGFNTVAQGPSIPFKFDKDGKIVNNGDAFEYWCDFMELYQKAFGKRPIPAYVIGSSKMLPPRIVPGFWTGREVDKFKKLGISDEAKAKASLIVKHFYKIAKEKNWPEVIFYIQDELANHGIWGGRLGVARAKFFQKLGKEVGFRTCASMNGPVEIPEIPYLNISIPNGALPITEENVKMIREKGSEYWIYNIGRKRFTMGYYLTKDYPKGRLQWSFYGASRYVSQIPMLPSLGSITFAMMWDSKLNPSRRLDVEQMRQGVMDYRYFMTLKGLVEKNKAAKNEALQKAVKKGADLMKMIRGGINTEIGKAKYGIWSSITCQRLRWRIATAIKEIKDAEK
jgi:hypothetical protein